MRRQKLEASQSGLLDDESIDIRDILTSAVSRVPMVGGLLAEIVDPPEANAGASIIYGPEREENFKRWFGDSKIVDEEGKPLVMYHGTGADIRKFDHSIAKDKEGRKRKLGLGAGKFYLTGLPQTAGGFAENSNRRKLGKSPNVVPVYVSMGNPITEENYRSRYKELFGTEINNDQQTTKERDQRIKKLDKILKAEGIDGVWEPYYSNDGKLKDIGQIGIFNPTQIKSIYNRGTFDPEDPDILSYREEPIGLLSV